MKFGIVCLRKTQHIIEATGDGGTLDDIQRNVRSGIREVGDAARRGVREVGDAVRSPKGSEFGKILLFAIGVALLLSGVSGLASVSVLGLKAPVIFSAPMDRYLDQLAVEMPFFYDMVNTPWILVLGILAVVLPLVLLIYLGIRFIFGVKAPSWKPGLVLLILWLVVVAVLAALCIFGVVSTEYLRV